MIVLPRTETVILQNIAHAIEKSLDSYLIVLLVDERPEEATDMQRSVKVKLYHLRLMNQQLGTYVAEMVIEKAKRLVEHKDVVILLD